MVQYMGLNTKNLSLGFVNNRLISTFVIHFLERIISKLATSKTPIFFLVTVAEETDLSLALSETLKTGFVGLRSTCI